MKPNKRQQRAFDLLARLQRIAVENGMPASDFYMGNSGSNDSLVHDVDTAIAGLRLGTYDSETVADGDHIVNSTTPEADDKSTHTNAAISGSLTDEAEANDTCATNSDGDRCASKPHEAKPHDTPIGTIAESCNAAAHNDGPSAIEPLGCNDDVMDGPASSAETHRAHDTVDENGDPFENTHDVSTSHASLQKSSTDDVRPRTPDELPAQDVAMSDSASPPRTKFNAKLDAISDKDVWASFVAHANLGRKPQAPEQPKSSNPPWLGKIAMSKEEQAKHQTLGVEAWDPERLAQHAICGNCGHTGHLLVDCAFPDDSGFISGCPVCNTKLHNADDCLRVQTLSLRDLVSFIIVRRGNKPPLRCRDPWVRILRRAIDSSILVEGPLPWTIEFTRDMIKGTERDKVWLEHHYFAGDYQTLPEDSTTGSDVDGAAANDDLLSQCHKLNKNID